MSDQQGNLPPVHVTYSSRNQHWVLTEDYALGHNHYWFLIPKGYVFDLASIPRLFWRVIAPYELGLTPPLIHDAIYEFRGKLPDGWTTEGLEFTRQDADKIFYELMIREGVSRWKALAAWRAVQLFGGWYWRT